MENDMRGVVVDAAVDVFVLMMNEATRYECVVATDVVVISYYLSQLK